MKATVKLYVALVALLTAILSLACGIVSLAGTLVALLCALCQRAADAAKRPARMSAAGTAAAPSKTTPEDAQVTSALVGLGFKRSEVARYVAAMGQGDMRTQIQEGIRALGAN